MRKNNLEVLRGGINTTFQDLGRENLYHIGIPFSGAMDKRNYLIVNSLVGNKKNTPVIEFAYQGPLLKVNGEKICFAISGDVIFNIISKDGKTKKGICYKTYLLEEDEKIDVLSTNKTVYGYLAINGGFDINMFWNSFSINTKAQIGPNNGKKLNKGDRITIFKPSTNFSNKEINHVNNKIEQIRVIRGTNYNYFSEEGKNFFF